MRAPPADTGANISILGAAPPLQTLANQNEDQVHRRDGRGQVGRLEAHVGFRLYNEQPTMLGCSR